MNNYIDIIQGIHPGKLIGRELKKRNITQCKLADQTGISYQTINAIIAAKRNLTTEQSLRIAEVMGYEEDFLALLQTYYDIKKLREIELHNLYKGALRIRKSLFWDVEFDSINWGKFKKAVINRILERGSKDEIDEIMRFYKLSIKELQKYKTKLHKLSENIEG
ncbi:MAG: HigA family addiction module antitoxin [Dysgonamonadaceae bacterium]|nr:HigA family addiction module antitoxin [Dysgonamonadaceae bacterium]MDD4727310.1 HigA family addiction module antitoxin [Dysgonamonadaceae bacterium]